MPISSERFAQMLKEAKNCGNSRLNLKLEDVADVLKKIEPTVAQYFRNYIKYKTGITQLDLINLELPDCKRFLLRLFAVCTSELVGGQRINQKGINEFNNFLKKFQSKDEIHNIETFREALKSFGYNRPNIYSDGDSNIEVITSNLKFHGMGPKTAALFMRFICEYGSFFIDASHDLVVPLDRVNARLTNHLINNTVLSRYEKLCKGLVKSVKKSSYQFQEAEIREFQELAEEIIGSKQDRVIFDNLWFIGHFYHDNPNQDCCLRHSVCLLDEPNILPYFELGKSVKLQLVCPFKGKGCFY